MRPVMGGSLTGALLMQPTLAVPWVTRTSLAAHRLTAQETDISFFVAQHQAHEPVSVQHEWVLDADFVRMLWSCNAMQGQCHLMLT